MLVNFCTCFLERPHLNRIAGFFFFGLDVFIRLHTKTLPDQRHNFVLTSMQPHNLPFSLKFFVLIGIWWKMHFFFSINPGTITGIRRIVGVGHTLCNGITRKVTHRTINLRPDSSVKFSPLLLKMDIYILKTILIDQYLIWLY